MFLLFASAGLLDQKNWTVILSTDPILCLEKIIKLFARRWKIEPMFNEIKNSCSIAHIGGANKVEHPSLDIDSLCVIYDDTHVVGDHWQ